MEKRIFKAMVATLVAVAFTMFTLGCGNATPGAGDVAFNDGANDGNLVQPTSATPEPVKLSSVLAEQGTFENTDLSGEWTFVLFGNGNEDYSWAYLQALINDQGALRCLEYIDNEGRSCAEVDGTLPNLSINSEGLITAEGTKIYGFMDIDRNAAYLFKINPDGVSRTGVMTRTAHDFDANDLEGRWTLQLQGNDAAGYQGQYMTLDIDETGQATCVSYIDTKGVNGCGDIEPLLIDLSSDGLLSASDRAFYGIMNSDKSAAYVVIIKGNAVKRTGVMTKAPVQEYKTPDLKGVWTVLLHGTGKNDFGWSYYKINIDDTGDAVCLERLDYNGATGCGDIPVPAMAVMPEGLVLSEFGRFYGSMDADKTAIHLIQIENGGVATTGVLRKLSDKFDTADLQGAWNVLLLDNGNGGRGWVYAQIDVDETGQAHCLKMSSSEGVHTCEGVQLPKLFIDPEGNVGTYDGSINGTMEADRNTVHLHAINSNGVASVGSMTKAGNDFDTNDLKGRWTLEMVDNGLDGFGWLYLVTDIDQTGDMTCVEYLDSSGRFGCDAVEAVLPDLGITPEGLIFSDAGHYCGQMEIGGNKIHMAQINSDGVVKTGVMNRTSYDFIDADLVGRWTVELYGNGATDYIWRHLEMEIDLNGVATCVEYTDSNGGNSCQDFPDLPDFFIHSDGFIGTNAGLLYGFMDRDGDTAQLNIMIRENEVTHTGVMTKAW